MAASAAGRCGSIHWWNTINGEGIIMRLADVVSKSLPRRLIDRSLDRSLLKGFPLALIAAAQ